MLTMVQRRSCQGPVTNLAEHARTRLGETTDFHGTTVYDMPITPTPVTYSSNDCDDCEWEDPCNPQCFADSMNANSTGDSDMSEGLLRGFGPNTTPRDAFHDAQAEEGSSVQHLWDTPWNALSSTGMSPHEMTAGVWPDSYQLPEQASQSSVTGNQSGVGVAHDNNAVIASPEGIEPSSLIDLGTSDTFHWTTSQVAINGDNFDIWAAVGPGPNSASAPYEDGFGEQYLPGCNADEASLLMPDHGPQPNQLGTPPTTSQIFHTESGAGEVALDQPHSPSSISAHQTGGNASVVARSPSVEPVAPVPPRQGRRVGLALFQRDSVNSEQCITCLKYFPPRVMKSVCSWTIAPSSGGSSRLIIKFLGSTRGRTTQRCAAIAAIILDAARPSTINEIWLAMKAFIRARGPFTPARLAQYSPAGVVSKTSRNPETLAGCLEGFKREGAASGLHAWDISSD